MIGTCFQGMDFFGGGLGECDNCRDYKDVP